MSLANLIKRGSLRGFATATPAKAATHSPFMPPTVATVATVAVAIGPKQAANDATGAAALAVAVSELPDWRELDQAYQAHHFTCHTCQAAGRGLQYGRRCGVGLVLWTGYSQAIR